MSGSLSVRDMIRVAVVRDLAVQCRAIMLRAQEWKQAPEQQSRYTGRFRGTSLDTFHELFLNKDYKRLGAGHFALAYLHIPSNLVVKVGGFSSGEVDTYPVYAQFCMDNPDVPFLPRVLHLEMFSTDYVAIMPVYYDSADITKDERYSMAAWIQGNEPNCRWVKHIPAHRLAALQSTCVLIAPLAKFSKVDLHEENVMQDAEGNPVITDPFSFGRKVQTMQPRQREIAGCQCFMCKTRREQPEPAPRKLRAADMLIIDDLKPGGVIPKWQSVPIGFRRRSQQVFGQRWAA